MLLVQLGVRHRKMAQVDVGDANSVEGQATICIRARLGRAPDHRQ